MKILRLETNKPVEVAFKYLTGKDCESLYTGSQKAFTVITLATGETQILYLSAGAGECVEKQLAEQNIRSSERVDLCKAEVRNGNKRDIEYQVKRVDAPAPPATNGHTNGNGANGVHPPAPAASVTPMLGDGQPGNGNAPAAPTEAHASGSDLETALRTVVAACHAARNYAKQIGYEAMPPFTSEDIRTMANTLMIRGGVK